MHDHSHSHSNVRADLNFRYYLGIVINSLFVGVEFYYGYSSNSMALVADAGHNLSDVLSLFLAAFANWISMRQPSERYTYQLKKATILSALINSFLLLIAVGGIGWETIQRLKNPAAISGSTIIFVSAIGITINSATAFLFMKNQKEDINVRAAFLHMALDALVSFGALLTGILILFFQWYWLDPVISLAIMGIILVSIWGTTKETVVLALEGVPDQVKIGEVKKYLSGIKDILRFHDLHIWAMSTSEIAMTVHLVFQEQKKTKNDFLKEINHDLLERFHITHTTIQLEYASDAECIQGCS